MSERKVAMFLLVARRNQTVPEPAATRDQQHFDRRMQFDCAHGDQANVLNSAMRGVTTAASSASHSAWVIEGLAGPQGEERDKRIKAATSHGHGRLFVGRAGIPPDGSREDVPLVVDFRWRS